MLKQLGWAAATAGSVRSLPEPVSAYSSCRDVMGAAAQLQQRLLCSGSGRSLSGAPLESRVAVCIVCAQLALHVCILLQVVLPR
jgi:hypothetical protein